jgi:sugar lactone lactonase YvrE
MRFLRFLPSRPALFNIAGNNRLSRRLFAMAIASLSLGGSFLPAASAQGTYTFRTLAGIGTLPGNSNGSDGGIAVAPRFERPIGIVVAADGTVYVSDTGNSVIRKITTAGVVSTFVGTPGVAGESNGTTTSPAVTFNLPQGMAIDPSGNLYVADYGGATIRKITAAGVVTTVAGAAGTTGFADGTGTAATFSQPCDVALDGSGNLYVADSGNHSIRKITPTGVVTTLAGKSGTAGQADGKGTGATFRNPRGIACDGSGNLYVADTGNNTIRKIAPDGTVTTLAGAPGTDGSADGVGAAARFSFPNDTAVDKAGNVYVADELNAVIRKIAADGSVTTVAGLSRGSGRADGQGSVARFDRLTAIAVDDAGTLYVADYGNHLIRKVSAAGAVTTISGTGGVGGYQNGSGYIVNPTLFQNPTHPVTDGSGNIYLTDTGNNSIRRIAADGSVSLFAGSSTSVRGSANGNGTAARFNVPAGLARDGAGNLYVADSANQLIRKISPNGEVTTLAGRTLVTGAIDGAPDVATFNQPSGVAVDGAGNVYVADYSNHSIRRVTAGGVVSTYAGVSGEAGSADGLGSAARFNYPRDLALDAAGNLWVADFGNHTIRKIAPGGIVTTVAGTAGAIGSTDGAGSTARFDGPAGLAADASGNVFIVDSNNSTVRVLTTAGAVVTIGGTADVVGTADGTGSAARFNHPSGIAVDAAGNLFVSDNRNNTLRKGSTGTSGGGGSGGVGDGSGGGTGGGGSGGGGSGGGSGGGGSGDSPVDPGAGGAYDNDTTGLGFVQQPKGMVADSAGNIYICDSANHCIKKIDANGVISTFAGQSGSAGSADGTGSAARFSNPTGIAFDSSGNLYVADTGNSTIRKVSSSGVVTTLAGAAGQSGSTDGTGTTARFSAPQGVAVFTTTGDVYVADSVNNTIRKITSAGVVTTYAGTSGVAGDADGLGAAARFNHPTGLAFNQNSVLIVADTYNNTIRTISTTARTVYATASGTITTAGNAKVVVTDPGLTGSPVSLSVAVAVDDTATTWAGKVATALAANTAISARYTVTANSGVISFVYLVNDGQPAANVALSNDTSAGIIAAPTSISTAAPGTVATIAGSPGIAGAYDGQGEYALFNLPQAVAVSTAGAIYVADSGNSSIRRIAFGSQVSTIAGIAGASGRRNGSGEQVLFNQPQGLLALGTNVAVVADTGNSVLRTITMLSGDPYDSVVSSVALTTTPSNGGGGDGGSGGGGGGGGGAPSIWFVAALGGLAALRRWTARKGA